jgi:predicted PurR-regulated permease PerM
MRRRPTELRPEHLYKFAGLLFLLALVYRFFAPISRVLLIVYAAAVLAVAFNVVVRRIPMQRRWTAALIAVVMLIAVGAATWFGGGALLRQIRGLVEEFPDIERELISQADWVRSHLGLDVRMVSERTRALISDFFADLGGRGLIGRAGGLLEWLFIPVLVFFGAIFAIAKPNDHLLVALARAVPADRRPAFVRTITLLGERLTGWVKGQLISMTTIGVLATIAFYLIGVPYALLFGVINGLTEFVPIVGPWVGGIPAVVVAFLDDPTKGVWAAVAILAIQQLETQIITPLVMQKAAEVHPFVTLFSIVLFGGIFGFLGILLALPLVLLIWTVVETLWVERAIDAADDSIPPVVKE